MFTRTLNIAVQCVKEGKTYEEYVQFVGTLQLIESIEILVIDAPAYGRVHYIIMVRGY